MALLHIGSNVAFGICRISVGAIVTTARIYYRGAIQQCLCSRFNSRLVAGFSSTISMRGLCRMCWILPITTWRTLLPAAHTNTTALPISLWRQICLLSRRSNMSLSHLETRLFMPNGMYKQHILFRSHFINRSITCLPRG